MDKNLYQEIYAISKMQIGQKKFEKWNNYDLLIDEKILKNIQQFIPVDNIGNAHSKSFRLTKKGQVTSVFNQINVGNNNIENKNIQEIDINNHN